MTGDGAQNHIPYNFFRGSTGSSSVTVDLPEGYDCIIRNIWVANASGTNPGNIYLEDGSSQQFFNVTIPNYPNSGYVTFSSGLYIVLPAQPYFFIKGPSSGALLSIDGDVVTPGTASLLPT